MQIGLFTKKTVKTAVQIDATSGKEYTFSILINIIDAKHIQDVKKVAELISSTKKNISDWYLQKRLQPLEKVAEEVKFRREAKKLKKRHNRLEKVVEQNFSSLFDKKMQNVYNIWKR